MNCVYLYESDIYLYLIQEQREEMTADHRLLILSCSQRKRPDRVLLPALERYDGPVFRMLRKFLRSCPAHK